MKQKLDLLSLNVQVMIAVDMFPVASEQKHHHESQRQITLPEAETDLS